MTDNESTDDGGNDGKKNDKNDRGIHMRMIRNKLKETSSQIDPDEIMYYAISFIATMIVPLSALGLAAPYFYLAVNIRPISESILEDLNCTELNLTAEELLENSVCSMETFETKYSLYYRQVNYFHFSPTFGVSFCESDDYAYAFLENFISNSGNDEIPDDTEELIGGENIGQCTQTQMLMTAGFAAATMFFALFGLLWLTVLSSHSGSNKKYNVHFVLSILVCACSTSTVAIYEMLISPLRSGVDPDFCDRQTSFLDCEEQTGVGFYCQISVAVLSGLLFLIYLLKAIVRTTSMTSSCCGKKEKEDSNDVEGDRNTNGKELMSSSHHTPWYKNFHFWIKLGRFSEYILATVAGMINFTTLKLLLPDDDETPISMSSYVWGDQFCTDGFFAIDEFRLAEDNTDLTDLKNFGDCKPIYTYKVLFTLLKVVITAGAALFLKRDAARNPFFYLGGLVADVATVALVVSAIVVFMTQIYPGRSGIEPSFCDQYTTLWNAFLGDGEASKETEVCNISLGPGFYVLCAVLPLTVVNLLVEFIAGEIDSEYGAVNAFQTVFKRLKRKEYRDAVLGSSNFYRASTIGKQKSQLSNVIEPMEKFGSDSITPETKDKASGK